jgi:hypothetical protein
MWQVLAAGEQGWRACAGKWREVHMMAQARYNLAAAACDGKVIYPSLQYLSEGQLVSTEPLALTELVRFQMTKRTARTCWAKMCFPPLVATLTFFRYCS